ncbi:unnamed protein product [Lathyrus sativus]|nr:unnamed protein product [Lathyrus sativus]
MTLWIVLPQLPLMYWGEKIIGEIASAIRNPLMTNECTAKKLRVSYARVLVEVVVSAELKEEITIRDLKGNKMVQKMEYEWKPPFCKTCNKVFHDCETKPRQKAATKQVWTRKQKPEEMQPMQIERTGGNKEETQGEEVVQDKTTCTIV